MNSSDSKQPQRKVLILGAGLSGIVAGKTLQDNGIDDFLILEGQDYIGGRIKQRSFAGFKIEEGCNWIQFANEEATKPIWKLKEDKNITGVWTKYSDLIIRNEAGEDLTNAEDLQKWDEVKNNYLAKQDELDSDEQDISTREGLKLLGWNPQTPAQSALEYLFTNYEDGRKPEHVSFAGFFVPEFEFFITDSRGVMSLYKEFYEKFDDKIKMNKKVVSITYSSTEVKVVTSDRELYTADYALCTFSTGVLASDMVKFSPPLPQWKKDAILKMPMSVYTKIYLKFPKRFWDDKEYILFAGPRRDVFPVFQDLGRPGKFPEGSGMLLITATGEEGRRIEKQSFEKTKEEIMTILRGIYGQNIPEPTEMYYPRWSRNPFIRGAYSEPIVGHTEQDANDLAKSLENLYFSGEGTSVEWTGYMQGAYLTGEEKAKLIAKNCKHDVGLQCRNGIVDPNFI